MSWADDARDALHKTLDAAYAPVRAAGAGYAQAQKAAMAQTDIVEAMSAALTLAVAAEALKDAATEAEKSARAALATAIEDTGAPEVLTMHHKAYMSRKASFVSVNQPDMVPDEFWNKPTPDKKAIKDALEKGDDVPGCTLIIPNGMTLNIRSRK